MCTRVSHLNLQKMQGLHDKLFTVKLLYFVQYYLWCTIAALPLRQVNETLDQLPVEGSADTCKFIRINVCYNYDEILRNLIHLIKYSET